MVQHTFCIIRADILVIARIFSRSYGAWKNTTQLAKYPRVLYVKPSNKVYISKMIFTHPNSHESSQSEARSTVMISYDIKSLT